MFFCLYESRFTWTVRENIKCLSETDVWFCVSDSGVGAGIDSYYEYLLKAYILLGDDMFLQRFNIVSNLISPCLHNSVCYFSSLRQSVSVSTF